MDLTVLKQIAQAMVAPGKGILAIDESTGTCKKRFEIWGDEDFDMDYFNDSLYIIEQIEKFDGIIIFNLE